MGAVLSGIFYSLRRIVAHHLVFAFGHPQYWIISCLPASQCLRLVASYAVVVVDPDHDGTPVITR